MLGQERDDALAALLAAVTVNLWAKKPRKWSDFLPQWRKKKQTAEQLDAAVEMLNRTLEA